MAMGNTVGISNHGAPRSAPYREFPEYPIGQTRLFSKRAGNAGYGVGLAMSCSVRPGSGRRQPGKRADPSGEGVAEHRLYREQSEGRQVTKRSFRTNSAGATALLRLHDDAGLWLSCPGRPATRCRRSGRSCTDANYIVDGHAARHDLAGRADQHQRSQPQNQRQRIDDVKALAAFTRA
jgi:hypothetical protein